MESNKRFEICWIKTSECQEELDPYLREFEYLKVCGIEKNNIKESLFLKVK